jgi:glycosyltransferase involved in cell wall biosynthesis
VKIAFYYRKPSSENYSIENVFDTVQSALNERFIFDKIYAKTNFDLQLTFSKKSIADVHHITGAVHYLSFGLPGLNSVITIHDLGHLLNTMSGWRRFAYKSIYWDVPLRKTRYITTISDFTRSQLIARFPFVKNKVMTIANPVSPCFQRSAYPDFDKPVVMQIGGGRNKNVANLVEAIAVSKLDVKLLLVRSYDHDLAQVLSKKGIEFEFRSGLTQAQLVDTYRESNVLFFASTYEGFGLPILEAMACGRPVVTSNFGSMCDVAGGAAKLVAPENPLEIGNAIKSILESESLRCELIEKGLERIKEFSPNTIARQYEELYQRICVQS